MSIVYRKTAKGVAEIETRAHRLLPRLRNALILVDGKRTDEELTKMVLAEPAATLAALLADGFIEVLATLAEPPPERRASAAEGVSSSPRDSSRSAAAIQILRMDAARDLNHQLGPFAEVITVKIERAKSMPELLPLLVQGAQMLLRMKGAAAAEAFAARFIGDAKA